MAICPNFKIFFILVPRFQGVIEKGIVKKIQPAIYDFESARINSHFFAAVAHGIGTPTSIHR